LVKLSKYELVKFRIENLVLSEVTYFFKFPRITLLKLNDFTLASK
jgi:hypothetical protein